MIHDQNWKDTLAVYIFEARRDLGGSEGAFSDGVTGAWRHDRGRDLCIRLSSTEVKSSLRSY